MRNMGLHSLNPRESARDSRTAGSGPLPATIVGEFRAPPLHIRTPLLIRSLRRAAAKSTPAACVPRIGI